MRAIIVAKTGKLKIELKNKTDLEVSKETVDCFCYSVSSNCKAFAYNCCFLTLFENTCLTFSKFKKHAFLRLSVASRPSVRPSRAFDVIETGKRRRNF